MAYKKVPTIWNPNMFIIGALTVIRFSIGNWKPGPSSKATTKAYFYVILFILVWFFQDDFGYKSGSGSQVLPSFDPNYAQPDFWQQAAQQVNIQKPITVGIWIAEKSD